MLAGLHNCSQHCLYLSVVQMTLLNAPQPRTALPLPFVAVFRPPIEVAFAFWQVRVCVCVAKSHCEWPPCPQPGQSCHRYNGHRISAPLCLLSNCALQFPCAPLSFFIPSSWNYCIISDIKCRPVEEGVWFNRYFPSTSVNHVPIYTAIPVKYICTKKWTHLKKLDGISNITVDLFISVK